ncbi:MAG: TrmO family methyltransferase [Caulobacter sp.]|nr:TrmO family methyltransferase [Caulobacter sp.]
MTFAIETVGHVRGGRNRPNRLGASVCRILAVNGLTLEVEGLDAIDGTPVVDIKPVLKGFLPRGEVREPAWAAELMEGCW